MGYFTLLLRKTKTYLSPTSQSHHFFHLRCQKTKPSLPPISGYILKSISKFYSLFNFFHFFHHLILLMKFYISNFGRLLLAFVRGVLKLWIQPKFSGLRLPKLFCVCGFSLLQSQVWWRLYYICLFK